MLRPLDLDVENVPRSSDDIQRLSDGECADVMAVEGDDVVVDAQTVGLCEARFENPLDPQAPVRGLLEIEPEFSAV
eukprot:m.1545215 g.1545215  ORF g.1545215 m.1545215 type:complete len:76 (-) comp25259_c0_seq3:6375-6602(-)